MLHGLRQVCGGRTQAPAAPYHDVPWRNCAYNDVMKILKRRRRPGLPALLIASLPAVACAHGGVVAEDDLCVINIGYLQAHFKVYVPAASGHRDYCEDIPVRGETVFVMEYLHDGLSTAPIEFRIIRNTTGKGRFAQLADVEALPDLDALTVRYEAPAAAPDVFTLLHEFETDGDYIGIVTAGGAQPGRTHTAVFPFYVGARGFGVWPWILLALLLLQLNFGFWRRRFAKPAALLLVILLPFGTLDARAGELLAADTGRVSVEIVPSLDPLTINRLHFWDVTLRDRAGRPISAASLEIAGGMPAHDHGLATEPKAVELGDGRYRIDGLRFHMPGDWVLYLTIDDGTHRERVTIRFSL